jgi:hypothetical protein
LAWNGSKFVAGGVGSLPLAYSFNGSTWYQSSFTGMTQCNGITWNGYSWFATGQGGTSTLATSLDGITWSLLLDQKFSGGIGKAIAARNIPTTTLQSQITGLRTDLQSQTTSLQSQITLNLYNALGYTQTWQSVYPSLRTLDVLFFTESQPIMLSILSNNTSTSILQSILITMGNGTVTNFQGYGRLTATVIIPANSSYQVNATHGISLWFELR